MKDLILLLSPAIMLILNVTAILLFWFVIKSIFEIFSKIKNKLFGTHVVMVVGLGTTTYETRRNFDNKVIRSQKVLNCIFPAESLLKHEIEVENEK